MGAVKGSGDYMLYIGEVNPHFAEEALANSWPATTVPRTPPLMCMFVRACI